MRHLFKFSKDQYYNNVKYILKKPNISLCENTYKIYFNKKLNNANLLNINGYEYVELGGIKWATMNIGANNPLDFGYYIQWADINGYIEEQIGEGSGKKYFDWDDYRFTDFVNYDPDNPDIYDVSITKYTYDDNLEIIESIDDIATLNWGNPWRIPTKDEYKALFSSTNQVWIDNYNGINISGLLIIDKNDEAKQIFLPARGEVMYGEIYKPNEYGYYWTSTNRSNEGAWDIFIDKDELYWIDEEYGSPKICGKLIRPVAN